MLERDYDLIEEDLRFGWIKKSTAGTVYGAEVGEDGKVDRDRSDQRRREMREKRKERSVDARKWWIQERQKVMQKGWHEDIRNMYADCLQYQKFRDQFFGMWQLPEDFNI